MEQPVGLVLQHVGPLTCQRCVRVLHTLAHLSSKSRCLMSSAMNLVFGDCGNRLLSELSDTTWNCLAEDLQAVHLPQGAILAESGDLVRRLYFPTTATVASQVELISGTVGETVSVGSEGVVGARALMGEGRARSRDVVVVAGEAYRIDLETLALHCARSGDLRNVLLRYANFMITQFAQEALCSRHHNIEQRLCRWLLLSQDRCPGEPLPTTHDRISTSLGVRREGVTSAVGVLRACGFVLSNRGSIFILDRSGIEARSCECYARVRQEMIRLLRGSGGTALSPLAGPVNDFADSRAFAQKRSTLAPALRDIRRRRASAAPELRVCRSI